MSCCGKNDSGTAQTFSSSPRMHGSQSGGRDAGVAFEYIGKTGLTAIGGVTRRTYLFSEPGAQVIVDRRDVQSLLQIPTLRRIH